MNGVISNGRAPRIFSTVGSVVSVNCTWQLGHQEITWPDLLRASLSMVLSAKRPDDLAGIDGKRELAKELLETVEKTGGTADNPARVQEVLFTEFVVQ